MKDTKAKLNGKGLAAFAEPRYYLADGREVFLVPWAGNGPQPWSAGHARIRVGNAEQIVKTSKLVKR